MPVFFKKLRLPVGDMVAAATDEGICLFDFEYRHMLPRIKERILGALKDEFVDGDHPHFLVLEAQMAEYFEGQRTIFDLPLQLLGSPFQVKVWQSLLEIPFGQTRTYMQQAVRLGDEKAIRAVASANGANGLAIIIPCHRVIGANGSLTGYAGGLPKKQWLLAHELKHSQGIHQQELFG